VGVEADPVKVTNTEGKQFTFEGLPVEFNLALLGWSR